MVVYTLNNSTGSCLLNCIENFAVKRLEPIAYTTGPDRHGKVEEKWKKASVNFVGSNSATLRSGGQFNEYWINEY